MSELINQKNGGATIRRKLLTGASALAMISWVNQAVAADDGPQLWIELGGQLERNDQSQQIFAPSFTQSFIADGTIPSDVSQKPPLYSSGFEGALEFDPADSRWEFSASIRYGRSNASRGSHSQTNNPPWMPILISVPDFGIHLTSHSPYVNGDPMSLRFGDTAARSDERHAILDFEAGRDVGIGLLGGKSTIAIGARFAQFTSKSNAQITANGGANWEFRKYLTSFYGHPANIHLPTEAWNIYHAKMSIARSFRGVGPSLTFKTSVPLAGNVQDGQIGLDLGVNGAVLFGRQRVHGHHQTYDDKPFIPHQYNFKPLVSVYHHHYDPSRSRSVSVPNLGGFAALSFNYADARISLGYRADFFFGAIDGGIDTRMVEDRGFFGPFASINVGIGD